MNFSDGDYKFVKTHHSHFLQYKNYLYRKYMSSKVDSGSYWRCRRDDCPARAKLDSSALLTCTNFNHNHPEEEFEGEDMEQDIKQVVSCCCHYSFPRKKLLLSRSLLNRFDSSIWTKAEFRQTFNFFFFFSNNRYHVTSFFCRSEKWLSTPTCPSVTY